GGGGRDGCLRNPRSLLSAPLRHAHGERRANPAPFRPAGSGRRLYACRRPRRCGSEPGTGGERASPAARVRGYAHRPGVRGNRMVTHLEFGRAHALVGMDPQGFADHFSLDGRTHGDSRDEFGGERRVRSKWVRFVLSKSSCLLGCLYLLPYQFSGSRRVNSTICEAGCSTERGDEAREVRTVEASAASG